MSNKVIRLRNKLKKILKDNKSISIHKLKELLIIEVPPEIGFRKWISRLEYDDKSSIKFRGKPINHKMRSALEIAERGARLLSSEAIKEALRDGIIKRIQDDRFILTNPKKGI